ncbi:MAG TPA: hydantoinase/oxoprolinase family protein [Pseudolabrys sp.]|nr:hydantoinase/oxoprolinase family protein [Pseudolabrys sp.]
MGKQDLLIGIDVGGTFTDAIVFDAARKKFLAAFKIPSTPGDPGKAVVAAVKKIAETFSVKGAIVFHGTTVGTNTLIERKGSKTALMSTKGFSDVIELRRQARPNLYNFDIRISEPLVPRSLRFDVQERVAADGSVVEKLDASSAIEGLKAAGVESVAVSFLHCYANSSHEEAMVAELEDAMPGVYVTRASDVCPEFREYERASTTVVNAYIGPTVSRYVSNLDDELKSHGIDRLMIVKSNGGLTSPQNAARYPVHLIESGPAAQLIATAAFARATGRLNLVAFDMGGTTAKAGLIRDGRPEVTSEFYADRLVDGVDVGGYAIRSPVLDLVEIGAGGGSIAWVDEANVLKVGPRSAGALPGPACYGRGGTLPTVTDAHAVIGTLTAELLRASGVELERELAVDAIKMHIAEPFGWTVSKAAYAIIDIAVANMAEMVRLATTRRGLDPRYFAILASGGAGPLHAPAVGEQIGSTEVVIPPYPGMFSAFGATLGSIRHEITQTMLRNVRELDSADLEQVFRTLIERITRLLAAEPRGATAPRLERMLEARFAGQLFELRIPLGYDGDEFPSPSRIEESFRLLYRSEYGFDLPDAQVQVVNLRLVAAIDLGHRGDAVFTTAADARTDVKPCRFTALLGRDGSEQSVPVYRASDSAGVLIEGPAIIEHSGSTVWVHKRQTAVVGASGEITVKLSGGGD